MMQPKCCCSWKVLRQLSQFSFIVFWGLQPRLVAEGGGLAAEGVQQAADACNSAGHRQLLHPSTCLGPALSHVTLHKALRGSQRTQRSRGQECALSMYPRHVHNQGLSQIRTARWLRKSFTMRLRAVTKYNCPCRVLCCLQTSKNQAEQKSEKGVTC